MRVANLMFSAGRGGLEQAAVDFSEALTLVGVEVHNLTAPRAWANENLDGASQTRHSILLRGWWDVLGGSRLRGVLRSLRPTHVVCHGIRALLGATRWLPPELGNECTVLAVTHNYSLRYVNRADGVLALTDALAEAAISSGVTADRICRVSNMVRVPAHMPLSRQAWRFPPVIGAMGRFVPKKGFALLIEALARLHRDGHTFRAVIGGDGVEREALVALIKAHGLKDIVDMPGWIEDRQAFFDSIDVAVLPSWHEPFGIALLEAMAQGLPIVATSSEGPSEILRGNRGGHLVPVGDPGTLAEALAALLNDEAGARALGRDAYALARMNWDVTPVARQLQHALLRFSKPCFLSPKTRA